MNPYTLAMIARQRQDDVALAASYAERRRPARHPSAHLRLPRMAWRALVPARPTRGVVKP
jgi:hypothetical protein